MARSSLLVHVVMVIVAVTIAYLYIYPTVQQIRENQDTAVLFDKEVAQVSSVNAQLNQKLTAINSIPLEDKQKLMTYIPDNLDDVTFMRTMEAILFASGIQPTTLQFGSGSNNEGAENSQTSTLDEFGQTQTAASDSKTIQSTLSVSFETDETSMYSFFEAVEQSAVPFVIKEASLSPSEEGGGVTAELVYSVHALATTTLLTSSSGDVMNMGGDPSMGAEMNEVDF